MTDAPPADHPGADDVLDPELDPELDQELTHEAALALAEERGAVRMRELARELVAQHRRVVRVGDLQVEVIEVAALRELLSPGAGDADRTSTSYPA
jgi:hypothetical protein